MTVNEVRNKYLEFFKQRGHTIIPSAPIVPDNDPTTLFVSSGMQPLVPYLLGQKHPSGTRLVNSQKSVRTGDIDDIGDNRHLTFFEMLGNWSLGDYFKREQLPWIYEFLTNELRLPKDRLWFTCFAGDEFLGLPKDEESAEIWKKIGIQEERIHFYDSKKNWWSRSGTPDKMPAGEPGGPDSEIFFDFQTPHDPSFGEKCHPNCDCGRFIEICNSVFMEYKKTPDGSFEKLNQKNVDFGGGLERLAATTLGTNDVFKSDVLKNIIDDLEIMSKKVYSDAEFQNSFRIVADHVRASVFIIASGVVPSNSERGYVLRRLIRRAVRHLDILNIGEGMISSIAKTTAISYKEPYPEILGQIDNLTRILNEEELRFRKTLSEGLRILDKMREIDAFILFTTYGFPIELTAEIAKKRGIEININEVKKKLEEHQALSRAGAAQRFAGGLSDHAEQTIKYHTAHHLLLRALQIVLGSHVHQRGSNITSERLRIDFSHGKKMTNEERVEVEKIVNDKIEENLPIIRTIMSKADAEKLGAEHEFGVSYPDQVSVYSVGQINSAFSIEYCGGPHVNNTADIGRVIQPDGSYKKAVFKIVKEEASSAGIRRIRAVIE